MWIQAPAHDRESLAQFREMRVNRDGEGDISQRTGGINGDLMRVCVDLADHEMRCVFGDGFGMRFALMQWRRIPGPGGAPVPAGRPVPASPERAQSLSPGTQPRDLSDQRRHQARLLLRTQQRENRAERHGHVGAADQLEHPQRMAGLVIPPGIAGHDRDPEHVDPRATAAAPAST